MAIDDNGKLTVDEAYDLVRSYVSYYWSQFRNTLDRMMEKEDVVQDIMLKLTTNKPNPDYDPNWKPGDIALVKKSRSASAPKKEVDTSYMLDADYNPEDPYDSLYHLLTSPEFNYIDKYDGRTTSKKYYIANIVKKTLIDKTRKRDTMKYVSSLDDPIGSEEDGDTKISQLEDPSSGDFTDRVEMADIGRVIKDVIYNLDITPLSDRIVGHSPITGEYDSDGTPIDTPLTARDIGIFLMQGYSPEEVAKIYKDKKTGSNVSVSTIKKRWAEALTTIKHSITGRRPTPPLRS